GERSWAIGVCRKMLANLRRKRTRREGLIGRFIRDLIPPSPPPLVRRDEELASALATLPASDREALLLAVWDELPPREIAKVLGISPNAAAIRVHRAKRRLRERLEP
ncbi:MAG: sigma-70 family RNA polymerase sigma factor, partial [bacterium]|nr:sigma-70 family RNA polymerase sigma factor [Candidatus Aquidulcis sp.]